MTDEEIIASVRSGDRESYAELVRRYHQRVISLCRTMLGDAAQADDAAQDVFVKAFEQISTFRGQSSFPTWIHRVATNHCLDLLRQRRRQRAESLEALTEKDIENLSALRAGARDPLAPLEAKELADRLLALFSDDIRTLLLLREVQGLSYAELAGVFGASVNAVKSRLKRARQEFQEKVRHFLKSTIV